MHSSKPRSPKVLSRRKGRKSPLAACKKNTKGTRPREKKKKVEKTNKVGGGLLQTSATGGRIPLFNRKAGGKQPSKGKKTVQIGLSRRGNPGRKLLPPHKKPQQKSKIEIAGVPARQSTAGRQSPKATWRPKGGTAKEEMRKQTASGPKQGHKCWARKSKNVRIGGREKVGDPWTRAKVNTPSPVKTWAGWADNKKGGWALFVMNEKGGGQKGGGKTGRSRSMYSF